jgi:hypothetical protein
MEWGKEGSSKSKLCLGTLFLVYDMNLGLRERTSLKTHCLFLRAPVSRGTLNGQRALGDS